ERTADPIPDEYSPPCKRSLPFQLDGGSAAQTLSRNDLLCHFSKQFPARLRVRIHKDQPIAGGCRRTGVSCASDLVDGLEHHFCAPCSCQFVGTIGGIIIANDQLVLPAPPRELRHRFSYASERFSDKAFLIESRDDD